MSDVWFAYHLLTHPNQRRPRAANEDAVLAVGRVRQGRFSEGSQMVLAESCLFAVSDGLHVAPSAACASRILLTQLEAIWQAGGELAPGRKLRQLHGQYCQAAASHPEREGMACTLVAAQLCGLRARIVHVGDSRVWLIQDGLATCLTRDHTALERMIRSGEIARTQAQRYASIYGALDTLHGYAL